MLMLRVRVLGDQGLSQRLFMNDPLTLFVVSGDDEQGQITTASHLPYSRQLVSTDETNVNSVCADYTLEGHFPSSGGELSSVPAGFADRPPTISTCELESLHTECVQRINMYRSGELKFSDGSSDHNVLAGLAPLLEMTGNNQCSSHQALGDLVRAKPLGFGCAGAHFTAFTCGRGARAQNSCCTWHKEVTYDGVKRRLFECLQSMWDEGITPGQKGHWEAMRKPEHVHASCGFAWDDDGWLAMNQDFSSSNAADTCSCDGKQAGEPDGCGGTCVACSEPAVKPCEDSDPTSSMSNQCSGPLSASGTPYCTCEDVKRFSCCDGSCGSVSESCPAMCQSCPVPQPTCPQGSLQTTSQMSTSPPRASTSTAPEVMTTITRTIATTIMDVVSVTSTSALRASTSTAPDGTTTHTRATATTTTDDVSVTSTSTPRASASAVPEGMATSTRTTATTTTHAASGNGADETPIDSAYVARGHMFLATCLGVVASIAC